MLRVCCTPLPVWGSSRFARRIAISYPKALAGSPALLVTRIVPFEEFSSPEAVPYHYVRCLLTVTASPIRPPTEAGVVSSPPAEAGRRLFARTSEEVSARRTDWNLDAMMLRSAEADPHVTETRCQ